MNTDDETKDPREVARADLDDIITLKRMPELDRYVKRRLKEILLRHEQATLVDDSLSNEQILRERHACKVLREEVVGFIEADEQNHRATLRDV